MNIKEEFKNVKLCIVSKNRSEAEILKYYNLGYRDFGENKAQELLTKVHLKNDIRWHFIGHLQSNKVKQIIPYVSLIHSIDSLKLIKEIDKQAKKYNKIMPVLIQFNLAKEKSKSGIDKKQAFSFIDECLNYSNIKVKGIMLMGPNTDNVSLIEEVFKQGKELFDKLQEVYPSIDTLSMGMSNDYKIAIKEGSTMVRIGSLLF